VEWDLGVRKGWFEGGGEGNKSFLMVGEVVGFDGN